MSKTDMQPWHVATLARYVIVRATDEADARAKGEEELGAEAGDEDLADRRIKMLHHGRGPPRAINVRICINSRINEDRLAIIVLSGNGSHIKRLDDSLISA